MSNKNEKQVVMHFIAAMDIAGSARVVLNLLTQNEISPFEQRVTSFVRASDGTGNKFLSLAQEHGIIVDKIVMYKRWDWGDVKAMTQIIKKHNVKIIHSHGYKSDIVGTFASLKTGVPMIVTAHGFIATDLKLAFYEKIGCLFLHLTKKVICVSENVRKTVRKSGVRSHKILLIPNAVDFEYFSQAAKIDFRKEWGIASDEILIGTAGRLSSEKAQANLIKAFAMIPDEIRNNSKLVIAGTGPEYDNLVSIASEFDIDDYLLLRFINDMRSFYKAIDIFCLPSLTEGSPLTILEAVATSKPIIATRVGSSTELINNSTDGFLVEPGNVEQLISPLKKLISDPQLRKSMGQNLNIKLKTDFNIDTWAKKIFNVYKEILK